ncbi:hypothetical protein QOZ80_2AG0116110 [Eleusine coracana subsp. coracana]|nr:hypothetical protein QOZ80_2AG0116110 [Eleusine coracana subsp. coracana]
MEVRLTPRPQLFIDMIGTCNGLLCMTELYFCDGRVLVVTVTNPITGEKLTLLRLPRSANSHVYYGPYMFSFGYHPRTGQYKVVHIPFQDGEDRFVLVCTLGHDQSWREVLLPTPCESHKYSRNNIIVSVDGSTYWLTKQCDRIVALNLEDDSITSFDAPPTGVGSTPVPALPDCQLTNVQARLGVVVTRHNNLLGKTMDVWVLECGGEQPRWSLNYTVFEPIINDGGTWIMAPYFTHGEYVLSKTAAQMLLYGWKVGDLENREDEKTRLRPLEGDSGHHERDG